MKRLMPVFLLLMMIFALASCSDSEEDIPLFYIKNGTEAYDPTEEIIENFYLTSNDEAQPDETGDPQSVDKGTASTEAVDIPISSETAYYDDTEKISTTTTADYDDVGPEVYWVSSGEVWHKTEDCSTLARSKKILSGTIEDAMLAGKKRACKVCYN